MNRARSTFIHYRHTLDLFKQSCRKGDVRKIGRDEIMEYEKFLHDRGLGAHTIRNKTIVVLSFLNTLGIEDLIKGRDLDFTPREIETYSMDQLQKFFFVCTDEENVIFQFFLHTGERDQEVRHTIWSDIDFDLGIVRVTPKEKTRSRAWKFQPKGKAVRSIPVPDSLAQNSVRSCPECDGGACVSVARSLEVAPCEAGRKTDRSLPRNVQGCGAPCSPELWTVR
jgi:integrase